MLNNIWWKRWMKEQSKWCIWSILICVVWWKKSNRHVLIFPANCILCNRSSERSAPPCIAVGCTMCCLLSHNWNSIKDHSFIGNHYEWNTHAADDGEHNINGDMWRNQSWNSMSIIITHRAEYSRRWVSSLLALCNRLGYEGTGCSHLRSICGRLPSYHVIYLFMLKTTTHINKLYTQITTQPDHIEFIMLQCGS